MNKGGFSWKRALGVTRAKSNISRATGIPLTKSGRQRKIGKIVTGGGCFSVALLGLVLAAGLILASAGTVWAATDGGIVRSWSPRGNAPLSGWTRLRMEMVFNSDPFESEMWTLRASNRSSVFVIGSRRVSRNGFFKWVRRYEGSAYWDDAAITWSWRKTKSGSRYRYVRKIVLVKVAG